MLPNPTHNHPEKRRFFALPIGPQIIGWFVLNALLLSATALLIVASKIQPVLGALLEGEAGNRVSALAIECSDEIGALPRNRWSESLERIASTYQARAGLCRNDGSLQAGSLPPIPESVVKKIREAPPRPHEPPPEAHHPPEGPPPRHFAIRADGLYWIGARLPRAEEGHTNRGPTTLLLVSDSFRVGGLLVELTPLWIGIAVLLASALFWIPLVRRITVPLREIRRFAGNIASGHFDTRASVRGPEELCSLSDSLNQLADRLEEFVTGQKRFLGDIAHELNSPLARMEWSLSVLEQRAGQELQREIHDVREETAAMTRLVEELLTFTRAGLRAQIHLETLVLRDLITSAQIQECPETPVTIAVPDHLTVEADARLAKRAIANVLRNAIRYAGKQSEIHVAAIRTQRRIILSIKDNGPGVPEHLLPRLCDPFFRPENARSRESGGFGLGLAIVQRCIEACGGTVALRNAEPHGLIVELTFETRNTTIPLSPTRPA
jgi:two-component system sensor histidine kinase CpxA